MSSVEIRMVSNRDNKPGTFITNSMGVSRRQFCKFLKGEKSLSKQEMFDLLDIQSTEPTHPIFNRSSSASDAPV
ncbi:hypothetical protein SteCoe_33768 [Stentor coeruleus]|uniref:HTH cro/C1-type domain-containing protein n=1 Tax=Stentor coeruleus TaxID=5963 RepID=A0A1R2AW11_9CILI|nr:hypothetical protein SteCoe_33768 [Stentor coeruleus]